MLKLTHELFKQNTAADGAADHRVHCQALNQEKYFIS